MLNNEASERIRSRLTRIFGSNHKIVIAPCMAEVYTSKNRDALRKAAKVKWSSIDRGVVALVYDTDSFSKKLVICLSSPKSGDVLWKETIVPYSTVASPHPTFQTFNSTRSFSEQAGILYENKTVARLVFQALEGFTSRVEGGKAKSTAVMRSHSFSVAPRHKHASASGNPVARAASAPSTEGRTSRVGTSEDGSRSTRRVVRRKTEPIRMPRLSKVIETDLCTTEL